MLNEKGIRPKIKKVELTRSEFKLQFAATLSEAKRLLKIEF